MLKFKEARWSGQSSPTLVSGYPARILMKMKRKTVQDQLIEVADKILYLEAPDGGKLRVVFSEGKFWFMTLDIGRLIGCKLMASMTYRYIPKRFVASVKKPTLESGIAKTLYSEEGMEKFFELYEPTQQFQDFVEWYHSYVIPVLHGEKEIEPPDDKNAIRELRSHPFGDFGSVRMVITAGGDRFWSVTDAADIFGTSRYAMQDWAVGHMQEGHDLITYSITEKRSVPMVSTQGLAKLWEKYASTSKRVGLLPLLNKELSFDGCRPAEMNSAKTAKNDDCTFSIRKFLQDGKNNKVGDIRVVIDNGRHLVVLSDISVALSQEPNRVRAWAKYHLEVGKEVIPYKLSLSSKNSWCVTIESMVRVAEHYAGKKQLGAFRDAAKYLSSVLVPAWEQEIESDKKKKKESSKNEYQTFCKDGLLSDEFVPDDNEKDIQKLRELNGRLFLQNSELKRTVEHFRKENNRLRSLLEKAG